MALPAQGQDEALQVLAEGESYVDRALALFDGHLQDPVLEIGAGTGTVTLRLVKLGYRVVATEIDAARQAELQRRLEEAGFMRGRHFEVRRLDLENPDDVASLAQPFGPCRSVVAVNVLEHVKDDAAALGALRGALSVDAKACVLVPAHAWLYGPFDRAVGHYRRYDGAGVVALLERAGFRPSLCRHFNAVAVAGWFLNFRVLGRQALPAGQLRVFNWLQPLLRLEDRLRLPFGLSIVAAGERGSIPR